MRPTTRSAGPFLSLAPDQLQIHIFQSRARLGNELDTASGSEDCVQDVGIVLLWIIDSYHEFVTFQRFDITHSDPPRCGYDCIIDALKLHYGLPSANRSFEFGRCAQRHQLGVQYRDSVADPLRLVQIVRVEEDGLLLFLQLQDKVPNGLRGFWVEVG